MELKKLYILRDHRINSLSVSDIHSYSTMIMHTLTFTSMIMQEKAVSTLLKVKKYILKTNSQQEMMKYFQHFQHILMSQQISQLTFI